MNTNTKIFNRRYSNWTYHSVYTDETKTKTKRVIDWNGKRYEVKTDKERNLYFIKDNTKYIINL